MKHRLAWSLRTAMAAGLVFFCAVACDREPPKPNAVQSPSAPDTAVGGAAIRAIEKAKGLEQTLGQAAERTADQVNSTAP